MEAAKNGTGNDSIAKYKDKYIKATIKKVDDTVLATGLVKMDANLNGESAFQVDDIAHAIASLKDSQNRLILVALPSVNISMEKGYVAKFKTTEHYSNPLSIELEAPTSEELADKTITTDNNLEGLFDEIDAVYHLNTILPSN